MAQPTRPTRQAAPRTPGAGRQRGGPPARRSRLRLAGLGVAVVLAVIAAMVLLKLVGGGSSPTSASGEAVSASDMAAVEAAPISGVPADVTAAIPAPKKAAGQWPALTKDGKPEVYYLGAEYCPYCAAQRWPLVVALSRFGTFTGLRQSHSSPSDVYPDTPTFTFVGSSYASDYLSFVPVETADIAGKPLQTATPGQLSLAERMSGSKGIPFLDFGNAYFTGGASYNPELLKGMSFSAIASSLARPQEEPGGAVIATANKMTAVLCDLTGDQPARVCGTAEIDALQKQLGR